MLEESTRISLLCLGCLGDSMEGEQLDALLAEIVDLEQMLEERDKRSGFSIFEVLGVVSSETRHSNMIAWLMDPNAKHGLGGGVLAALLERHGVGFGGLVVLS